MTAAQSAQTMKQESCSGLTRFPARFIVLFGILLYLVLPSCADEAASATLPVPADEQPAVQEVPRVRPIPRAAVRDFQKKAVRAIAGIKGKAKTSAMVYDVATGEVLFAHNAADALIPASNMKVVTGAAAVARLGSEEKLETRFVIDGTFEDGLLDGNLIVVGTGDPTLAKRYFNDEAEQPMQVLARLLVERGLKRVAGRILADGRAFTGPKYGPQWPKDDRAKWYMAEVSALVYNDNNFELLVANSDGTAQVSATPDIDYYEFDNRLAMTKSMKSHLIRVSRARAGNRFTVSGRFYDNGKNPRSVGEFTVFDGDSFFVRALRAALIEAGVVVEGGTGKVSAKKSLEGLEDLLVYSSSLERTLGPMLKNSQNLYAELVLRILGLRLQGEGSFAAGASAVRDFLDEAAIWESGTVIADGSGLSRSNRLSARQLVKILGWMAQDPERAQVFRRLLAEPRQTGTLRKRLPALAGRLFAKTGTLSNVSGLSGYVRIGQDRLVAFSILSNQVSVSQAKRAQDAICKAIAELDK